MTTPYLEVIDAPAAAIVALDPTRSRLLGMLREPHSASELARSLDLPRQRVNYHLRKLEDQGLVTAAGSRNWGGIVERLVVATARTYLVSPETLGTAAPSDSDPPDRLSAAYLAALAGRAVREVGALIRQSRSADTFALDADISFATPTARADFSRDLAEAVTAVVARHHDESGAKGRKHRLVVGSWPIPTPTEGAPR